MQNKSTVWYPGTCVLFSLLTAQQVGAVACQHLEGLPLLIANPEKRIQIKAQLLPSAGHFFPTRKLISPCWRLSSHTLQNLGTTEKVSASPWKIFTNPPPGHTLTCTQRRMSSWSQYLGQCTLTIFIVMTRALKKQCNSRRIVSSDLLFEGRQSVRTGKGW